MYFLISSGICFHMTESYVLIVIDLRCLSEIVLVSFNHTMLVVTTVNIHLSKYV